MFFSLKKSMNYIQEKLVLFTFQTIVDGVISNHPYFHWFEIIVCISFAKEGMFD